jgi:hypothetical protein
MVGDFERKVVVIEDVSAYVDRLPSSVECFHQPRKIFFAVDQKIDRAFFALLPGYSVEILLPLVEVHAINVSYLGDCLCFQSGKAHGADGDAPDKSSGRLRCE